MTRIVVVMLCAVVVVLMSALRPHAQGTCGLQLMTGSVAFCETFDAPAGTGTRSGDLDSTVWGVSRVLGDTNFGQGTLNAAPPVSLVGCNGTTTVLPPHDVIICNGQLREATNDNASGAPEAGGVTVLAMYPKQPFDFAGRTGSIGFDVSNDTHGLHAAWPELWVTDKPVPAPFTHLGNWVALPQHGFGIRFAAQALPGQYGLCPTFDNTTRWTVDSAVVVRNFVYEDATVFGTFGTRSASPLTVTALDCVVASPDESGALNHVEVQVRQNQIEVYATDAGTVAPLKHIATIANANLTLTRGLVWLEDAHYNADKGSLPSQRQHTFVWDNLAFDGPFTYRDLSFDALDNAAPGPSGTMNLARFSGPGQTSTWNVLGLPSGPTADSVRVLFNFFHYTAPTSLTVTVNGHVHSAPWPYPEAQFLTWRTLAVTIPITELVPGTNVVRIGAPDQPIAASNVDIVLVNAGTGASPPQITSASVADGAVGSPFSYQIAATNSPGSYGATGVPAGLSVNSTTGLISGTPQLAGTFALVVSASNSAGTGTLSVSFTVRSAAVVCQQLVRVNGMQEYLDQLSNYCTGAHP
jgi:hypothetical protein